MKLRTQTINSARLGVGLMTLLTIAALSLWRAGLIHLA